MEQALVRDLERVETSTKMGRLLQSPQSGSEGILGHVGRVNLTSRKFKKGLEVEEMEEDPRLEALLQRHQTMTSLINIVLQSVKKGNTDSMLALNSFSVRIKNQSIKMFMLELEVLKLKDDLRKKVLDSTKQ